MAKEQISLRLPKETKSKLEALAEATGRDKTYLATEAIEQYCDVQMWQVEAIMEGIRAANNGEFISHEELKQEWEAKLRGYEKDQLDKAS